MDHRHFGYKLRRERVSGRLEFASCRRRGNPRSRSREGGSGRSDGEDMEMDVRNGVRDSSGSDLDRCKFCGAICGRCRYLSLLYHIRLQLLVCDLPSHCGRRALCPALVKSQLAETARTKPRESEAEGEACGGGGGRGRGFNI